MKRLVIVNGTMGAGKTTVCRELKRLAAPCAFLDGDWCWDMEPFVVTEETKALVQDNIVHTLGGFLACPAFETVIFCWVLHRQEIIDGLLARLDLRDVQAWVFTLMVTPEALRCHIKKDIAAGLRTPDVLERSLERLALYEAMGTEKLFVQGRTPAELAREIMDRLGG
ncbi:MAG: AAA family ATPase [Acutalibacter sp.]|nr:AAA family ATPase [Acutalibacter sp.]